MRLCRFLFEELALVGFYEDDHVIPLAHAAEEYAEAVGDDLDFGDAEDLLDLLPGGDFSNAARTLGLWLPGLDAEVRDSLAIPIGDVDLLPPLPRPGKILLLAGNYAAHVAERGGTTAERTETFPYVFLKPTDTLIGPGDPIRIPTVSPDHVDWECELGVVIGRRGKNIPEAEALSHVGAYTVVNDISDRKFLPNPDRKPRERDKFFDWMHGKWHDTFLPVGPCLCSSEAIPNPQSLRLKLAVNGKVKQDADTGQMIFPVAAIVAFLSSWMTLEVGDLIATGTPAGVGSATGEYLKAGDVVEATVERVGTLRNPVEAS